MYVKYQEHQCNLDLTICQREKEKFVSTLLLVNQLVGNITQNTPLTDKHLKDFS